MRAPRTAEVPPAGGLTGFGSEIFEVFLDGLDLALHSILDVHAAAQKISCHGFEVNVAAAEGSLGQTTEKGAAEENQGVLKSVIHSSSPFKGLTPLEKFRAPSTCDVCRNMSSNRK